MKRKILALMALVFLMSAALALPAWAETVTRDGLVVTLTTDRESYDSMNAVNASLTITNTNSYAVKNVSAEITAPNGYVLHGDTEEEHGTLRAGQSQTQETAVYRADYAPKLPKTGDGSHFVLWVVLFILCVAGVCAFAHNPHAKRFLSLLLCTAILAPYALRAVPVRAETAESTIAVSKSVKVAGKSVTLTGTVKYEAVSVSKNAVRTMEETPVSDLSYFSKNGEIIITGYKGNSTELVIPSEIDGKPVTTIGNGNYDGYWGGMTGVENIKRLVMPDTIKKIMAYTFRGCENLESVRFSKALSDIGGEAFVGCTSLKEIDIQTTGNLDIGYRVAENGGTFARCESLEKVSIVCGGNLNLSGAIGASAHYQGGGAFENCYYLETVYLSAQENLYVGDCSFLGCDFMTTVELDAKNLAVIGNSAFTNCLNRVDKETRVILPREAQVRIDDNAFSSCQMLNKIALLKNVTEIGSNAFSHCGTTVGGLTIIGNRGSYAEKYVEDHNKNKPNDTIKFKAVEDTCDHYDAIHNKEYYYDPLSDKPYYGWDEDHYSRREEGHQIGYLNNRCCKQCNAVIADSIVLYGNTVYSHTMANGVCSLCGYQAPQLTPASITDFALRENSATIGNSVHVQSGMAYGGDYYLRKVQISVFTDNKGAHGYYSNVSKEFAYGEATSYDLSKLGAIAINGQFMCEAHKTEEAFPAGEAMVMVFVSVYNEDGTDGENTFGADAADTVVVSCAHPTYTDVHNASIPIQYTDNKDGETHIWQSGYDRICDTCHANMGVVYGKENIADHDYTNGDVCPCGYDRSNCQHAPSEIKTYNRHLFAPLNEKQHKTIAIVWDMVCSTCGKTYEEIDYVGDNSIGLSDDHVWDNNGKCLAEGCGYECLHPEKKADGSDNYQDKYLGTISLTDNGDGVTHHHVYNVERTCLLCKHSWTVTIDDPAEKHTIQYLDEAGEYKHDVNEHWLEVPEGCSCGYRTGKTEIRNKEEHKPQVTYTGFMHEEDLENTKYHDIYIVEHKTCVCGKDYGVDKRFWGTETHNDKDGNGTCDECGGKMPDENDAPINSFNSANDGDKKSHGASSDYSSIVEKLPYYFGDYQLADQVQGNVNPTMAAIFATIAGGVYDNIATIVMNNVAKHEFDKEMYKKALVRIMADVPSTELTEKQQSELNALSGMSSFLNGQRKAVVIADKIAQLAGYTNDPNTKALSELIRIVSKTLDSCSEVSDEEREILEAQFYGKIIYFEALKANAGSVEPLLDAICELEQEYTDRFVVKVKDYAKSVADGAFDWSRRVGKDIIEVAIEGAGDEATANALRSISSVLKGLEIADFATGIIDRVGRYGEYAEGYQELLLFDAIQGMITCSYLETVFDLQRKIEKGEQITDEEYTYLVACYDLMRGCLISKNMSAKKVADHIDNDVNRQEVLRQLSREIDQLKEMPIDEWHINKYYRENFSETPSATIQQGEYFNAIIDGGEYSLKAKDEGAKIGIAAKYSELSSIEKDVVNDTRDGLERFANAFASSADNTAFTLTLIETATGLSSGIIIEDTSGNAMLLTCDGLYGNPCIKVVDADALHYQLSSNRFDANCVMSNGYVEHIKWALSDKRTTWIINKAGVESILREYAVNQQVQVHDKPQVSVSRSKEFTMDLLKTVLNYNPWDSYDGLIKQGVANSFKP